MIKDSEKPLDQSIIEWLEMHGYPLEMEVAKVFRAYGFYVQQSAYYEDPDEKKYREIDVMAYSHNSFDADELVVCFAVECKTTSTPWLVFTSEDATISNNPEGRVPRACPWVNE